MKIIFFGASKFVIPMMTELNKRFDLALVVTTEKKDTESVRFFCKTNNIPYVAIENFNDAIISQIKSVKAPVAVLAYFGMILSVDILNIFPKGIINIHPSLLPLYRGATPVQSAILNGDGETGVTIIKLDEKMDHGPIICQEKELIMNTDTTESLHGKLFRRGSDLLIKILPKYIEGSLSLEAQNDPKATISQRSFSRQDGFFDYVNPPSRVMLDRMIRAYHPWPGAWTIIDINNKETRIKLLPGDNIQVEGKKIMTYKDFFNGYPHLKEKFLKFLQL